MPYDIGEESEIDSNPIELEGRAQSIKTPELIARDVFPTEAWAFEDPDTNTNPKMILLDPWVFDGLAHRRVSSRNTVLTGAVDSNGNPNILQEVDTIGQVELLGTTTPVEITYADGFLEGEINYSQRITTDIEPANWVDLAGSRRHYLFADHNSGTITYDKTIVKPQYGQAFDKTKHSLLHMETELQDEYGNTWTASGATQSDVQKKFDTYSYVFDGANDYLQCTQINPSGQPFTIEFWFRTDADDSRQYLMGGDTSLFVDLRGDVAGDYLNYYISGSGGAWDLANPAVGVRTIIKETWYHFVLEWDGGFYRFYLNGVLDSSVTTTTPNFPIHDLQIGNYHSHATNGFDGYIDEVRITIGNCRYGEAFTPSEAPFTEDAVWFDTQAQKMKVGGPTAGFTDKTYCFLGEAIADRRDAALLHFNGDDNGTDWWDDLIDEYGNKWTFGGTAKIEADDGTNTPKFDAGFLYLDGNSDNVETTEITSLGSGPWTAECWWHTRDILQDNQTVFTLLNGSAYGVLVRFDTTGADQLELYLSSDGASWDIANASLGTETVWANNTWYHIRLEFDGTDYKIYVNGVEDISVTNPSTICPITIIRLGKHGGGTVSWLNGGIDEFRLTVGHTRYGAAFTPDTAAFVKDGCINEAISYGFANNYYETGWINRSDWTNVHMGSDKTKNVDSNVQHNLNRDLRDLNVQSFISRSGSWADAHNIGIYADANGANSLGTCLQEVSPNAIKVHTGTTGTGFMEDNGTLIVVNTENWYYNNVVQRKVG